MNEVIIQGKNSTETAAKVVYILYLAALAFGITSVIGVIIAYVNRNDAPDWLKTHYQFQIRTFWIGMLYVFLGGLLSFVLVGYLILLFWVIWLIVRCIKGLKVLSGKKAHPDPVGWML